MQNFQPVSTGILALLPILYATTTQPAVARSTTDTVQRNLADQPTLAASTLPDAVNTFRLDESLFSDTSLDHSSLRDSPLRDSSSVAQLIEPSPAQFETIVNQQGLTTTIEGGQQINNNLFHQFDTFNVESGHTADFVTPNSVQSVIGQVSGGEVSHIDGTLTVSGSDADLYLINPAGILFGENAQLNLNGGLTATTADQIGFGDAWLTIGDAGSYEAIAAESTESLEAGPSAYRFTAVTPGAVINQAELTVNSGEFIRLVGGEVVSTGTLRAPGGEITLSAVPGESLVRLSSVGGVLNLEVNAENITAENITAENAEYSPLPQITARSLPDFLTGEANAVADALQINPDGSVALVSADSSSVVLTGMLDVANENEAELGGEINVFADEIQAFDAGLYASGEAGGGLIRVGGNYQGEAGNPTADTLSFSGIAHADALTAGDGGQIILWSDGATEFAGQLSARGADLGGGGLIETSGLNKLTINETAQVFTDADSGEFGTWLLDPTDLTVVDAGGSGAIIGGVNTPTDSLLLASTLVSALEGTNVTLQATERITVDAEIDASGNAGLGDLRLEATTLNLNEAITLKAGSELSGSATTVNLGATGRLQNAVDAVATNGTINLAAATYQGSETLINRDVALRGQGAGRTVLSGENNRRVLNISGGNVAIEGMTIRDGSAVGGAGIFVENSANLILTDSTLENNISAGPVQDAKGGGLLLSGTGTTVIRDTLWENNSATFGGAIAVVDGHELTVEDSSFIRNTASRKAGAIDVDVPLGSVDLTIRRSNFERNQADQGGGAFSVGRVHQIRIEESVFDRNRALDQRGGAISNGRASMFIRDSIFSNNSADDLSDGTGGAISTQGDVTLSDTLFENNVAGAEGGALSLVGNSDSQITTTRFTNNQATIGSGGAISLQDRHELDISNSLLDNNSAELNGGVIDLNGIQANSLTVSSTTLSGNQASQGSGGAIAIGATTSANIIQSTVANNSASQSGGGIIGLTAGNLVLSGTIVADNTATTGADIFGVLASGGHNLVEDRAGSSGYVATDLADGLDAALRPLADNGGELFTHALSSTSAAIDAGNGLSPDQRSAMVNNIRDIGAYERLSVADLVFTAGEGQTATVTTAYADPLAFKVVDSLGGGLDNVTVFLRGTNAQPNVVFTSPTTVVTDSQGEGSVSFEANSVSGLARIIARPDGLSTSTLATVTNLSDVAANILIESGDNQMTTVGDRFDDRLIAKVVDRFDNPVEGAQVNFSTIVSTGADGLLSHQAETTGSSGGARIRVRANTVSGGFSVLAESSGFSAIASLTNLADIADKITIEGHGSTVTAGDLNSFTVTARDQYNNIADSYNNAVNFSSSDSQTQFTGALANGLGSFQSEFRTAGIQSFSATDGTFSDTQSNIAVSAAAPSNLTLLSGTNQSTLVNTPFAEDLVFQLSDRFNNPILGETITFTLPSSGASAQLTPRTAITDSAGQAALSASANNLAGAYTIEALLAGLSETISLNNTSPSSPIPTDPIPTDPVPTDQIPTDPSVPVPIASDIDSFTLSTLEHSDNDSISNLINHLPRLDSGDQDQEDRRTLLDEYALNQLEQSLTEEYARYWQQPFDKGASLAQIQQILQQAEDEYQSNSAVVYAMFVPAHEKEGLENGKFPQPEHYASLLARRLLSNDVSNAQDQLLLLVIPPDGPPIHQQVEVTRRQLQRQAQVFNIELASLFDHGYQPVARDLYRSLLAPVENQIQAAGIDHLMYVLDSGLSSIPLGAMMDEETYAIERYNLSVIPSVGLLQTAFGESPAESTVLGGGSDTFAELAALPAVPIELEIVESAATSSQILLNEQFEIGALSHAQQTAPKNIMHIATHAQFNPGSVDRSYIQFWQEQLSLPELQDLSLEELELLILSACTTAIGNREAELGFAGLAAATGVEASIGSLWNVSDVGTMALMAEFYDQLKTDPRRAAALRASQLSLLNGNTRIDNNQLITQNTTTPIPTDLLSASSIDFTHPFFWSGFTLVGNPWW